MPEIKITEETFELLCELRKNVPKGNPSELIEWLADRGAQDIGISVEAVDGDTSVSSADLHDYENSENLDQDRGEKTYAGLRDSGSNVLFESGFASIQSEPIKIFPEKQSPSQVNIVHFSSSYLLNVEPSMAYVEGKRFRIRFWNEAVFATIKSLIDKGVAIEDIEKVLSPLIKIGNPEGSVPIKGLNISHAFINSPRISWECIEKLNNHWYVDVRVTFRWNEKAKIELRGLSYEIGTNRKPLAKFEG